MLCFLHWITTHSLCWLVVSWCLLASHINHWLHLFEFESMKEAAMFVRRILPMVKTTFSALKKAYDGLLPTFGSPVFQFGLDQLFDSLPLVWLSGSPWKLLWSNFVMLIKKKWLLREMLKVLEIRSNLPDCIVAKWCFNLKVHNVALSKDGWVSFPGCQLPTLWVGSSDWPPIPSVSIWLPGNETQTAPSEHILFIPGRHWLDAFVKRKVLIW